MASIEDLKKDIKNGLIESYRHRTIKDAVCGLCGRTGLPVSLHVVEFYHSEKLATPAGFVLMSRSYGRNRGSIPACLLCCPACPKCCLPISTRWVIRMADTIGKAHPNISVVLGNGICQHVHPIHDFRALFRRITGVPMMVATDVGPVSIKSQSEAVAVALEALRELQEKGDMPGLAWLIGDVSTLLRKESEKTYFSLAEDRLNPKGLVSLVITNVALKKLTNGEHHVYRGVLNFQGNEIFAAYKAASQMMVRYGMQTEDVHKRELEQLRGEIRSLG